jgi:hypothetical protein
MCVQQGSRDFVEQLCDDAKALPFLLTLPAVPSAIRTCECCSFDHAIGGHLPDPLADGLPRHLNGSHILPIPMFSPSIPCVTQMCLLLD